MSLKICSEDLLLHIWKFIPTNQSMVNLVSACNDYWKLANKWGYIKSIDFGFDQDYMNLIHLLNKSNTFLNRLTVKGIDDPLPWLPITKWPKEIYFERCIMGTRLIDPDISNTEVLVIEDVLRTTHRKCIQVNWKKFPKLRILDVYATDINLTGIEHCQDLEAIRIDICNNKNHLPKQICKLSKLVFIASNSMFKQEPNNDQIHFESSKLKICLIPKTKDFTSNSKQVPDNHLKYQRWFVNIQAFKPFDYV